MSRIVTAAAVTAALALGLSGPVRADVLTLKTGATEQGIILRETPDGYWVQLGTRMKLFYAHAEVATVERESEDAHLLLAARWEREAESAAVARAAAPAPRRARRDGADDGGADHAVTANGDVIPKDKRYAYIKGGAFAPGAAGQRDVVKKLGDPDTVTELRPGVQIYQYETSDGDAYALQFEQDDHGRSVLKDSWFVSDGAQRARQARKTAHHPW